MRDRPTSTVRVFVLLWVISCLALLGFYGVTTFTPPAEEASICEPECPSYR